MRRKKGQERAATTGTDGRVTPVDIQQAEFRLAFRGYNERDVDAFLDRVTEDLASYMEENMRLRSGSGGFVPQLGSEAVAAQAQEILARAREEAGDIVRRAEQEADGIHASAAGSGGDARGALAPFLSREREFLQGLGSLVQTHAEEITRMVLAVRTRAGAASGAGPVEAPPEPGHADADAEEADDRQASEAPVVVRDAAAAGSESDAAADASGASDASEPHEASAGSKPEEAQDDSEDRIVIPSADEPAFSSDAPNADTRERSLRELFWGDD